MLVYDLVYDSNKLKSQNLWEWNPPIRYYPETVDPISAHETLEPFLLPHPDQTPPYALVLAR